MVKKKNIIDSVIDTIGGLAKSKNQREGEAKVAAARANAPVYSEASVNAQNQAFAEREKVKAKEQEIASRGTGTGHKVKFNNDGSVDVSINGQDQKLTKDQYSLLLNQQRGGGGGRGAKVPFDKQIPNDPALQRLKEADKSIPLTPEQQAAINKVNQEPTNIPQFQEEKATNEELAKGALGAGVVGVAGGAVGAALLAAPFTGGASLGVLGAGAAAGFAGNAVRNILNKKAADVQQSVSLAGGQVKLARQDIESNIVALNHGLITPEEAADNFQAYYSSILSAEAFLKKDIDERATFWDDDAKKKMQGVEQFRRNLPIIRQRFANAVQNPDITAEFSPDLLRELNTPEQ